MARSSAVVGQTLFHHFLAPLVLGGDLTPGPAVGPGAALSLGDTEVTIDPAERTDVEIARVRVARRLVPIDVVVGPSKEEWALAAALHDLVHALHPGLDAAFVRHVPAKLIDGAAAILDRIPPAASVGEALSRHTFFARTFDLKRTDTTVSWWLGSRRFLGTEPPPRLLAWPDLRRVRADKVAHTLMELRAPDRDRVDQELRRFLTHLPLTDLATASRPAPEFAWNNATLGLLLTEGGRALGLRALELGSPPAVDAALGRATRQLVTSQAWQAASTGAGVLAARATAHALTDVGESENEPAPDATYARTLGAAVAVLQLPSLALGEALTARTRARLEPLLRSRLGEELSVLAGHFLAILGNAAGSAGGSSTSIDP